jgi:hypothetical protein
MDMARADFMISVLYGKIASRYVVKFISGYEGIVLFFNLRAEYKLKAAGRLVCIGHFFKTTFTATLAVLALATLGLTTQIGFVLFRSCGSRWPRRGGILSVVDIFEKINFLITNTA